MGTGTSFHWISTMELPQSTASTEILCTSTAKDEPSRAFTSLLKLKFPGQEICGDFPLCFATASITLSAERCLNVNYWIRFIFCKYYCSSMNFGINESEAGEAGI